MSLILSHFGSLFGLGATFSLLMCAVLWILSNLAPGLRVRGFIALFFYGYPCRQDSLFGLIGGREAFGEGVASDIGFGGRPAFSLARFSPVKSHEYPPLPIFFLVCSLDCVTMCFL